MAAGDVIAVDDVVSDGNGEDGGASHCVDGGMCPKAAPSFLLLAFACALA